MGLETVLGIRRQGFFTPYRYAAQVPEPGPYPELERVFAQDWGPGIDGDGRIESTLHGIEHAVGRIAHVDGPPPEPRWSQSWFPRLDAAAAYTIVLAHRPRMIVEVGSGHSTRFLHKAFRQNEERREALGPADLSWTIGLAGMEGRLDLDVSQRKGRFVCIDPAPRASLAGLDIDWRREVLGPQHLALFAGLGSGDIAFFDSSHILWPGTDVDLMLNRILPVLRPGVLVHIHDVLLPDPYPPEWAWVGYTEQLGLAGYLTSPLWRIVWSSHYAVTRMGAAGRPGVAALPMPEGARETSLWLRRR